MFSKCMDNEAVKIEQDKPKKENKRYVWKSPEGTLLNMKKCDKFYRDFLAYWHGSTLTENVDIGGKKPLAKAYVTVFDPENPVGAEPLEPSPDSPVCKKCGLFASGCQNPFMRPAGSDNPLITIVFDSVTRKEDVKGQLGVDGWPGWIARIIHTAAKTTGVNLDDVRWFPLTRCANGSSTKVDYKIKGNWCRFHLIDDLRRHPPKLIIPVGTSALGMLCHKSNAQDWQGKQLTYRGWPDDWLTDKAFMFPRTHPLDETRRITGHPVFGAVPEVRIPMMPIQAPRIILFAQNPVVTERWKRSVLKAVALVKTGVAPKKYLRKWYRFTKDVDIAEQGLREIIDNPGMLVCYDTETTGLKPWAFHPECLTSLATAPKIVSMMFRWKDPTTGEPRSIGFPWDYAASPMQPHLRRLTPLVMTALQTSRLIGHNLTFDVLFTFATIYSKWLVGWDNPEFNRKRDQWLCALADAATVDTWHAAYTLMQKSGSLGLEILAYTWAPDMAGYEEDMVLLIELHREAMHPGEGKGGHYLNCSEDLWPTHVTPYVMGDVESCYEASENIMKKLEATEGKRYTIPLAKPGSPGKFGFFTPQSRDWVYKRIMAPAATVLMKIMGRGMFVDQRELRHLEGLLPVEIQQQRLKFRNDTPEIEAWCVDNERQTKGWELDLENKTQLKALLFEVLNLPVKRLTKTGKKVYGEEVDAWVPAIKAIVAKKMPDATPEDKEKEVKKMLLEFAATDKFTLNSMAVEHPNVRPLQDYRKVYKLYSTYVRPLHNVTTIGLDKKARVQDPHLCFDSCIHASFMLTGTRGGRLSCKCLPLMTLVCTNNGIVPLESVKVGDKIQGSLGITDVVAFQRTGLKATLRFTLETGRALECSPDHMLYVNGRWQRASDVAVNDNFYICASAGPESEAIVPAPSTAFWTSKPLGEFKVPEEIDTDVAFAVGHYLAEGCIGFNKVRSSVATGFGANQSSTYISKRQYKRRYADGTKVPSRVILAFGWDEGGLREKLESIYCSKFGVTGTYTEIGSPAYTINSQSLALWLLELGCGGYSGEKRVPPSFFKTKLSVTLAFLSGLFEGDGSSKPGTAKLDTDSLALADGVLLLLSRVGILASKGRTKRPSGSWRYHVRVLTDSRERAKELFWSEYKRGTLKSSKHEEGSGVAWLPGMTLKSRLGDAVADQVARSAINTGKRINLSQTMLKRAAGKWETAEAEEYAQWALDACANSVKVLSVESLPEQEMCDITTASGDFLVNGIRVHNSPNLQQLPRDGEIKALFTSRFGDRGCMYGSDLSQIELRLLAIACGDPTMLKAYYDDVDLHTLTTSRIFKVPYEHFSKGYMKQLQEKGDDKIAKQLSQQRNIGKCVDPSTLISVNGRIMRIGNLHPGREPDTFYPVENTNVQGPSGDIPVKHFYANGVSERVLVVSRRGLLACSLAHRFLLEDGTLVCAKDLSAGNTLAAMTPLKASNDEPTLVFFDPFGTKPRTENYVINIDVRMAYALGLFMGDGFSSDSIVSIYTRGSKSDFDWQNKVEQALNEAGFETDMRRDIWEDIAEERSYGMITFGQKRVSDTLVQLGLVSDDRRRERLQQLPDWLFNASQSVKFSFMAGFIDTCSSVDRQGSITITASTWYLAQDLTVLMRSAGILHTVSAEAAKNSGSFRYRLHIKAKDAWIHFGPLLKREAKRAKLCKPTNTRTESHSNDVLAIIPLVPDFLVEIEVDTENHLYVPNGLTCRNTCNFLTGYGGGAFGLQNVLAAKSIYLPKEECERIIDLFFSSYPSLKKWIMFYKWFIEEKHVAVSLFGRVRIFEEMTGDDQEAKAKALRAGVNHVIQSTASDMMLLALIAIEQEMRANNLESILVSTVHDSLLIDCIRSELPVVHEIADYVLNNFPVVLKSLLGEDYDTSWITCPIAGDSEVGVNYLSCKSIGKNPDWDKLLAPHADS